MSTQKPKQTFAAAMGFVAALATPSAALADNHDTNRLLEETVAICTDTALQGAALSDALQQYGYRVMDEGERAVLARDYAHYLHFSGLNDPQITQLAGDNLDPAQFSEGMTKYLDRLTQAWASNMTREAENDGDATGQYFAHLTHGSDNGVAINISATVTMFGSECRIFVHSDTEGQNVACIGDLLDPRAVPQNGEPSVFLNIATRGANGTGGYINCVNPHQNLIELTTGAPAPWRYAFRTTVVPGQ